MGNEAGLKSRLLALSIDYLTILAWGVLLLAISMFIYFVILDGIPEFDELGMNLISLTMVLPVFLYSIIMEAGKRHATLGKYKMRIQVTTVHSKEIRLWQVVVRNIIKFLPWQFAHMMISRGFAFNWEMPPLWMMMLIIADVLPFVWLAVIFLRKDHRGIHDLLSNTVVVNASS